MIPSTTNNELLPHLFRKEFAKMTAVLCHHFGLKHIEIAEDIVSDTFAKATELWGINGLPENPRAWLYKVAKNKTKDYFKHIAVFENQVSKTLQNAELKSEIEFEFTDQNIHDSQLAMIFVVCNPCNSIESQICLALQILCGFSVEEIANAFLTKTETIKKRLMRAKANLRDDNFQTTSLNEREISTRLETVLKTLYLLFNEGYFSKSTNQLIRKELCAEALRLSILLTENQLTNTPQTNALVALMFFQSSRIEARVNEKDEVILFEEQDRSLWDKSLIEKGNYYLINACQVNEFSKYHLEASIAYWHTTPQNTEKWNYILQLYNHLIIIEYSSITALNRAFAYSKVYGKEATIKEVLNLNLQDNNYYHSLLGYLYTDIDPHKAETHYYKAIQLTKGKDEKQTLKRQIDKLKGK